jgi:2-keto-4-pentenoate hydratase
MIELELAVRLGGGSSPLAITGVAPALDVVDCRIDAYDVNGADMVADAAFAGFAVLGPWTPADHVPDVPGGALEGPTGRIAGDASAVAGGIEAALAGVAADWAARGRPLAPDTVVLTGAWAPPLPLAAGRWRGALKGLGEVVVNVG